MAAMLAIFFIAIPLLVMLPPSSPHNSVCSAWFAGRGCSAALRSARGLSGQRNRLECMANGATRLRTPTGPARTTYRRYRRVKRGRQFSLVEDALRGQLREMNAIRHINELLQSLLSGNGNGCVGESGEGAFGVYPRDL